MAALESLVKNISDNLSRQLQSEEEKDCVLAHLRTQFVVLRRFLQDISTFPSVQSPSSVLTQSVATQTEHYVGHKHNGTFVDRPLEDHTGRWWVCACGKPHCPTCQAEKAASFTSVLACVSCLKYEEGEGSCRAHSKPHRNFSRVVFDLPEQEEEKEKVSVKRNAKPPSHDPPFYFRGHENVKLVKMLMDPLSEVTGQCSWYILQLHPAVSASGIPGRKGKSLACGIISLVFSHMITNAPVQVIFFHENKCSYPGNELYNIITTSISEGLDSYMLNYRDQEVELSIEDTVLLASHLEYHIQSQTHFQTMAEEMLVHYCLNLECGQTLLFIGKEEYKVISIVCRMYEGKKYMIAFDPQYHEVLQTSSRERDKFGVFVVTCLCETQCVLQILPDLENCCGALHGPCSIAILNTSSE